MVTGQIQHVFSEYPFIEKNFAGRDSGNMAEVYI